MPAISSKRPNSLPKNQITLGIETSCDETSFAVLKGKDQVLSNIIFSSLKEHEPFGGVVPEIASRSHLQALVPCLESALKKAKISLKNIDLIAVTQGPGLLGSLLVGVSAGKALALALKKPLIGVDHVIAHIYSGFLSEPGIRFPLLGLVVSGGHTLLIEMRAPGDWTVLGKTIDDAAGEAFDKVAKILGLGYPGGPEVDRLAQGQDPKKFFFTRPLLSKESLDFSFSGLKTAVYYTVQRLPKKKLSLQIQKSICAGFQESVCDVLVEKSLRALRQRKLKTLVVGGGVSANRRLRAKLLVAASQEGVRVVFPSMALCQDNAAMIAALGAALYKPGSGTQLDLKTYPEFHHGN